LDGGGSAKVSHLGRKITAADYYDLPGNHDAYNDRYFAYYLANSVQAPR